MYFITVDQMVMYFITVNQMFYLYDRNLMDSPSYHLCGWQRVYYQAARWIVCVPCGLCRQGGGDTELHCINSLWSDRPLSSGLSTSLEKRRLRSAVGRGRSIVTSYRFSGRLLGPFFQALDRKTTQLNQKQISGLALHLIFHRFSPFNCCLSVVL